MSFNTSGNKADNMILLNQNKRFASSSDNKVAELTQLRPETETAEPSCQNGVCQVVWKPRRQAA